MRPEIALLLCLGLGLGGCDRQSAPQEQGAEEMADGAADPALAAKGGTVDRSHAGERAPGSTFLAPDGSNISLSAFRGRPVLLNLWATWCAPCVREMPTLDALASREGQALHVIAVSQDLDGKAKVDPYFARARFKALKPYLDPELKLSMEFNANLPTTILYDSEGREVWRVTGAMDWAGDRAARLIAEAK